MSEITVEGKVWTTDWPTEPDWYWFYGWKFGRWSADELPKLHAVRVTHGANAVIRLIDGAFMYKQEAHQGIFTPMEDLMTPAWRDVEEMAHGQEQRD